MVAGRKEWTDCIKKFNHQKKRKRKNNKNHKKIFLSAYIRKNSPKIHGVPAARPELPLLDVPEAVGLPDEFLTLTFNSFLTVAEFGPKAFGDNPAGFPFIDMEGGPDAVGAVFGTEGISSPRIVAISCCINAHGTVEPIKGHLSPLGQ